jgi:hypothetical protein
MSDHGAFAFHSPAPALAFYPHAPTSFLGNAFPVTHDSGHCHAIAAADHTPAPMTPPPAPAHSTTPMGGSVTFNTAHTGVSADFHGGPLNMGFEAHGNFTIKIGGTWTPSVGK